MSERLPVTEVDIPSYNLGAQDALYGVWQAMGTLSAKLRASVDDQVPPLVVAANEALMELVLDALTQEQKLWDGAGG